MLPSFGVVGGGRIAGYDVRELSQTSECKDNRYMQIVIR